MNGGPGAPLLRTSPDDGEGPMIPNCKNVSAAAKVDDYITGSYLTTWGSVHKEANSAASIRYFGIDLTGQGNSNSYCRSYAANANQVFETINNILPLLGNKVLRADKDSGKFKTDFIDRQHGMARWKDRYYIFVESINEDETVVRIFREVYISRPYKGDWSPYVEAISVGHNEAWILTKIDQLLVQQYHK